MGEAKRNPSQQSCEVMGYGINRLHPSYALTDHFKSHVELFFPLPFFLLQGPEMTVHAGLR